MKLLSVILAAAGVTLLASFGALAFEGGVIADATGGVGSTTPVQFAMPVIGVVALALAVVLLLVGKRRSQRG